VETRCASTAGNDTIAFADGYKLLKAMMFYFSEALLAYGIENFGYAFARELYNKNIQIIKVYPIMI
jgi:hypothetical protein